MMETDSLDRRRTVVVSGVPNVLPLSRMADKLTIHFQSGRRSHGGDVDVVKYPTNMKGVAFVAFDKAEDMLIVTWAEITAEQCKLLADADKVVKKEDQIMMDDEFPQNYSLTVFPFSKDVFLYVSGATVDLSVFGSDQDSLIQSLQSSHRSIRFQSLPEQRKATIEGPFSAVQALREDLIRMASRFKPSVQTAALQRRETSARPCSKANQVSQRTAEAQSLFSKGKSQNTSLCQKVSEEGLRCPSSSDADSHEKEKELKAARRREMSTRYRTESSQPCHREVVGGETKAGFVSPLPRLDPLLKETSAKQQRGESSSEKYSRSGRILAGNHVGSFYSSTDYLKSLSSSIAHGVSRPTGQRHVSTVIKSNIRADAEQRPGDSENIWVDLNTFRYIEKFHKRDLDEFLECVDVITECNEGSSLMWLSFTEKQPSKAASRICCKENFRTLIKIWQSKLGFHEIFYDKAMWPSKQKLIQICEEAKSLYDNVLYIFEDSCIKVIGPSSSSLLFSMAVENKMTNFKKLFLSS